MTAFAKWVDCAPLLFWCYGWQFCFDVLLLWNAGSLPTCVVCFCRKAYLRKVNCWFEEQITIIFFMFCIFLQISFPCRVYRSGPLLPLQARSTSGETALINYVTQIHSVGLTAWHSFTWRPWHWHSFTKWPLPEHKNRTNTVSSHHLHVTLP